MPKDNSKIALGGLNPNQLIKKLDVEKLNALEIKAGSVDAENITGTSIIGKNIIGSNYYEPVSVQSNLYTGYKNIYINQLHNYTDRFQITESTNTIQGNLITLTPVYGFYNKDYEERVFYDKYFNNFKYSLITVTTVYLGATIPTTFEHVGTGCSLASSVNSGKSIETRFFVGFGSTETLVNIKVTIGHTSGDGSSNNNVLSTIKLESFNV